MVCIVQSVEQIAVERVDIDEARECLDCARKALGKSFGCVLYFARVESANSTDLEARADLRRKAPLSERFC